MKGRNELRLNTATMIEIVQQWLDRELTAKGQTVQGFERASGTLTHTEYVVFLEAKEKAG